ncbi:MAG: tRNA preQ1(34) S-adenosylmethionine ribosyltransferase-isomerase QueA [Rickettsiales bacterium]|nr:tRNA preQ1(34) S-adenosylmethionine ribosyltransferase-isomerase QueA [Rickettsiales bacterium]
MRVDLFDFSLPEELIATHPASPRDSARLLHVDESAFHDLQVRDVTSLLRAGDVMVFNNTKVIPARLFGRRGTAKIEILLHKEIIPTRWQVFARPAKRLSVGDSLFIADDFTATVIEKLDNGQVILQFNTADQSEFYMRLMAYGDMPLPPYIKRPTRALPSDVRDYQTVYAEHEGSVAAPTAGLHFTTQLLQNIAAMGVHIAYVTLHVGGGTFLPVKADDTLAHVMHSEWGEITSDTAAMINAARQAGGRVIAVGTTSMRLLESAADEQGNLGAYLDETAIFITPGYHFKMVDCLMTNFHLPKSTLFMLVSAFSGLARMKAAYAHAMKHCYRFYSYGDASFLERIEGDLP